MWTVVEFTNENAVEAVPSHWVKKDVCGWPKNNIKKHIQSRTILNKHGFDYFPSRTLKKGISSYLEAKLKAKKAEVTSDLSNSDEIQTKIRRKKVLVQDPPIFNELLNGDNLSKSANDYESLHNCQIMSSQIPVKRRLLDATSSSQCNLSKSANGYETLNNCQMISSQMPVKRRLFDTTSSSQGIVFQMIFMV
ncbi:uncharacterized protein LOC132953195 [Metopolophium dirhodum]|uniref:uncharacterized protein LOC132934083 n=1 Tax=Metopolophium dirhodum TaxID=44670 RepID=UPI00298F886E|nr:uncharacterized protein LOC132934083 [Metopolophium dirhodum]XP_060881703.1 uncharacterized protein LOC132953195 [Metopolophium dirhodum]